MNSKQLEKELSELLNNYEQRGQSEARAIAEVIKDGIDGMSAEEQFGHAKVMVDELFDIVQMLQADLEEIDGRRQNREDVL